MKGFENRADATNATAGWRGVIHRDGVYYAELAVTGQAAPMHVALHGVTTASQADQALKALLGVKVPTFSGASN